MTRKRKSNRAAGESTAEDEAATTSGDELSSKSLYEVPTSSARCVDDIHYILNSPVLLHCALLASVLRAIYTITASIRVLLLRCSRLL